VSLFKLKKVVYNLKNTNSSLKLLISNLNIYISFITYFIHGILSNLRENCIPFSSISKGFCIGSFSYFNLVYPFYIPYAA